MNALGLPHKGHLGGWNKDTGEPVQPSFRLCEGGLLLGGQGGWRGQVGFLLAVP